MAKRRRFPNKVEYQPFNDPSLNDEAVIRWIGSTIALHEKAESGQLSGKTWQQRFPDFQPFLEKQGLSPDDAVQRYQDWGAEKSKRISQLPSIGISAYGRLINGDEQILLIPTPGEPYPVIAIETAQKERGMASRPHFVLNTDYHIVPGSTASVCPHARPPIPLGIVERIASALRDRGSLKSDQTIHWCGWEDGLQYTCDCDRETIGRGLNQPDELQYVTLDQMAAKVNRSKRTLEGWLKKGKLPNPDVKGGGGKPHQWVWLKVREALQDISSIPQPERFPSLRST